MTPVKKSGHLGRAFAFVSDHPEDVGASVTAQGFVDFLNEEITLDTLDSFCGHENIDQVDFIRCDTEGAEHAILKGATKILKRDRPVLMFEIHPHSLKRNFNSSAESVWQFFQEHDYQMYYLKDQALAPAVEFFDEPYRDYFCVPQERRASFSSL